MHKNAIQLNKQAECVSTEVAFHPLILHLWWVGDLPDERLDSAMGRK